MESLLIIAFVTSLVGFITSSVTLYKIAFKKKAQRLPF